MSITIQYINYVRFMRIDRRFAGQIRELKSIMSLESNFAIH